MSLVFNTDDILKKQDWTFPIPIAYGPDRFFEIGKLCTENEIKNPLIVTDKGSKNLPFISSLREHLKNVGIASNVFSDFHQIQETQKCCPENLFLIPAHMTL